MGESTMIKENIIMITEWTIIKMTASRKDIYMTRRIFRRVPHKLFISRSDTILWA